MGQRKQKRMEMLEKHKELKSKVERFYSVFFTLDYLVLHEYDVKGDNSFVNLKFIEEKFYNEGYDNVSIEELEDYIEKANDCCGKVYEKYSKANLLKIEDNLKTLKGLNDKYKNFFKDVDLNYSLDKEISKAKKYLSSKEAIEDKKKCVHVYCELDNQNQLKSAYDDLIGFEYRSLATVKFEDVLGKTNKIYKQVEKNSYNIVKKASVKEDPYSKKDNNEEYAFC